MKICDIYFKLQYFDEKESCWKDKSGGTKFSNTFSNKNRLLGFKDYIKECLESIDHCAEDYSTKKRLIITFNDNTNDMYETMITTCNNEAIINFIIQLSKKKVFINF